MRLTKEQHENYMKDIMSKYDNPEDCAEMLSSLRSDFDESVNIGEVVPKSDYDELRAKYIERFFEGDSSKEDIKNKQKKDIRTDGKDLKFEDLFKFKEGYNGSDD